MSKNKLFVTIYGNDFQSSANGDDSAVLIKALGKGKPYNASLYWDEDANVVALPTEYTLTPLGGDLVEIHSKEDHINSTEYLFEDDYRQPITWGGMVYLQAVEFVKKIKKYSVRKPEFWVEEGDHYFAYTIYLKGKTTGEVFSKLAKMYLEIEANIPKNTNALKKQIMDTK